MKNPLKALLIALAFLFAMGSALLAGTTTTELVQQAWAANGGAANEATVSFTQNSGGLTFTLNNINNNLVNTAPKIYLEFPTNPDWRKYQTLVIKYTLTSTNSFITADGKDVCFSLCDNHDRGEIDSSQVTLQQNTMKHFLANGTAQTATIDLRALPRSAVTEIDLWFDYLEYPSNYSYTLKITSIQLTSASPVFDGEALSAPAAPSNKTVAQTLTTTDNLALKMNSSGAVIGVSKAPAGGGTAVDWSNSSQPGGFLIRDTTSTANPTQITGTVASITGGYSVTASNSSLHVNTTCNYTVSGNTIHVSMTATNTASTSRYLTLYFALPLKWGSWTWQSDLLHTTAVGNATPYYEEVTYQSPIATLSNPANNTGFALGVALNEPRKYRIEYNEQTGIFYVAFDVALTNLTGPNGSLNAATCDAYLYACDQTWGYRSALQSFYNAFPQWFTQRTGGGGWQLDGGTYEPGLRFSWNQSPTWLWTQNSQTGVYNGVYIEPRDVEFSMTDHDASVTEGMSRINNLAAASSSEWTAIQNLSYTQNANAINVYATGYGGLEGIWDTMAESVTTSGILTSAGAHPLNFFYASWIGEDGLGMSPSCNLDVAIPNGRGALAEALLHLNAQSYAATGGAPANGWSLDEYICDDTTDYNSANFKYSPFPLTFERDVQSISVPVRLTLAAWSQDLSQQTWSNGMIQFANLQGNFTFSAPYLDVFGCEGVGVADPSYNRVMAYNRAVTYLPYTPQADADTYYNLLYDIYPGWGLDAYQYQAMAPVLDTLNSAGWQPVTYVTSTDANIRVERYGSGDPFFVVCYNTNASGTENFSLAVNTAALGHTPVQATEIFGPNQGSVLTPSGANFSLSLPSAGICVLEVQTAVNGGATFATQPIAGDSDVIPNATNQTVVGAYMVANGGTGATVNGIAFTPISAAAGTYGTNGGLTVANVGGLGSGVLSPGLPPFSGLSSSYQSLLQLALWSTSGLTVTVNHLTAGKQYVVRFWCQYADNGWGNYDVISSSGSSSGNAYWNYTYFTATPGDNSAAGSGLGEYVTSTFVANESTQTFTFAPGGPNGAVILNAVEVVQTPLSTSVQPTAGDTDVLAPGPGQSLIGAWFVNNVGTTVNGVAFTPITANGTYGSLTLANVGGIGAGAQQPGSAPFSGLSSSYQTLLQYAFWSVTPGGMTTTFNNLTAGTAYVARFWFQYADGGNGNYSIVSTGGTSSANAYWNYTYFTGTSSAIYSGLGEYATVAFVAGSTSQTFAITAGGPNGASLFNAVELIKQ